ncbi:MAG: MBL fold metallo-hydrolase [Actinomycetota bacterium]|nr:MBL fold metallo-hydrolase [Actinomycetota bacterium]
MGVAVTTTEVTPTLHLLAGPAVNAVVLTDVPPARGVPFTLVDSGYPGYAPALHEAVTGLGLVWADLAAVLVTHAHIDHVGALPALLADLTGVPVLTGEDEARHARGEVHESATPADLLPRLLQHGVAAWAAHIVANGATRHVTLPVVTAAPPGQAIDVPGHPVPLVTPGHTTGHTCFVVPEADAILTGDALVTGHNLSRVAGPQVLRGFFQHDVPAVLESLALIEAAPASLVVPGHGPVWREPLAEAAALARSRASQTL